MGCSDIGKGEKYGVEINFINTHNEHSQLKMF
jgi:hypothetical protein